MRIKIYTFLFLIFSINSLQAQLLWSDNFDNYTIGNLGPMNTTDGNIVSSNPPVPGQGGWAVLEFQTNNVGSQIRSYEARIEPEAGRGNVLVFEDIPQLNATGSGVRITRVLGNITSGEGGGIESHWSERASGNNILKFEYDLYTGNLSPTPNLIN